MRMRVWDINHKVKHTSPQLVTRFVFDMADELANFITIASPVIDGKAKDLQALSLKIWEKPELGYEEHFAHGILCDFFEEQGFEVTRSYTLPTAYRAVFGAENEGPTVAVLSEYDALPGVGHGCGHNLIAIAGNYELRVLPKLPNNYLFNSIILTRSSPFSIIRLHTR